ncbi:MAG: PLDc N-terminal domain-containing protein [Planctomycetes bacterium]|nr:PLDc N-terminal domain-containing protein [Planctomycetota bacterium]
MEYSLLGALIFALDLVAIVSLLLGRGSVGHKVLWIVLILLLPVLGMILYFLLGRTPADA